MLSLLSARSTKTIKGTFFLDSFLPLPPLALHLCCHAPCWEHCCHQTFNWRGVRLWGLFKRTGASLTDMYSSYRLRPRHPAAGDLLEGPWGGRSSPHKASLNQKRRNKHLPGSPFLFLTPPVPSILCKAVHAVRPWGLWEREMAQAPLACLVWNFLLRD